MAYPESVDDAESKPSGPRRHVTYGKLMHLKRRYRAQNVAKHEFGCWTTTIETLKLKPLLYQLCGTNGGPLKKSRKK